MQKQEVYGLIEDHYRANFDTLVSKFSRYVGGWHNAEDTVQDAYCKALKYWESYNVEKDFQNWFSRILVNCVKDTISDERTRGMVDKEDFPHEIKPRALNRLIVEDVKNKIAEEDGDIQVILNLYFFQQWPSVEIAEIVPQSHPNVRQIIHKFRKNLREEFGKVFE